MHDARAGGVLVVEVGSPGQIPRLLRGTDMRQALGPGHAVGCQEGNLAVQALGVVEAPRQPAHHLGAGRAVLDAGFTDPGQVVRLGAVDQAVVIGLLHRLALVGGEALAVLGLALAGGEVGQGPGELVDCPGHALGAAIVASQDGDPHDDGLRQVDQGRLGGRRQGVDERRLGDLLHQRAAGRVHDELVALLHLVHYQAITHRILADVRLLAGCVQRFLHVEGVRQAGQLVGAMEHLVAEGAQGVSVEAGASGPVDPVLAHGVVWQALQVTLPHFILDGFSIGQVGQDVFDVRHEVRIDSLAHGAAIVQRPHRYLVVLVLAHQVGKLALLGRLLELAERQHLARLCITHGHKQVAEASEREVRALQAVHLELLAQLGHAGLAVPCSLGAGNAQLLVRCVHGLGALGAGQSFILNALLLVTMLPLGLLDAHVDSLLHVGQQHLFILVSQGGVSVAHILEHLAGLRRQRLIAGIQFVPLLALLLVLHDPLEQLLLAVTARGGKAQGLAVTVDDFGLVLL